MSKSDKPRRAASDWRGTAWAFVVTLVIIAMVRSWVVTPFNVPSGSMLPTLPLGSIIMTDRLSTPERGDIVVFHDVNAWTGDPNKIMVKRLVGVGGDVVTGRDGELYVNGTKVAEPYVSSPMADFTAVVPAGTMFLIGDNRGNSNDARCRLESEQPNRAFVPDSARIGVVRSVNLDFGDKSNHDLAAIPTNPEQPPPSVSGGCR